MVCLGTSCPTEKEALSGYGKGMGYPRLISAILFGLVWTSCHNERGGRGIHFWFLPFCLVWFGLAAPRESGILVMAKGWDTIFWFLPFCLVWFGLAAITRERERPAFNGEGMRYPFLISAIFFGLVWNSCHNERERGMLLMARGWDFLFWCLPFCLVWFGLD